MYSFKVSCAFFVSAVLCVSIIGIIPSVRCQDAVSQNKIFLKLGQSAKVVCPASSPIPATAKKVSYSGTTLSEGDVVKNNDVFTCDAAFVASASGTADQQQQKEKDIRYVAMHTAFSCTPNKPDLQILCAIDASSGNADADKDKKDKKNDAFAQKTTVFAAFTVVAITVASLLY